jgi:hypothetical protein
VLHQRETSPVYIRRSPPPSPLLPLTAHYSTRPRSQAPETHLQRASTALVTNHSHNRTPSPQNTTAVSSGLQPTTITSRPPFAGPLIGPPNSIHPSIHPLFFVLQVPSLPPKGLKGNAPGDRPCPATRDLITVLLPFTSPPFRSVLSSSRSCLIAPSHSPYIHSSTSLLVFSFRPCSFLPTVPVSRPTLP